MSTVLIRNGLVITQNPSREILEASIFVRDGKIVELPTARNTADEIVDATGRLVTPGFIQIHVHLCQALFRGLADDLNVVDWLRLRVWPLEQAHDARSVYASARLAIGEMVRGGTTAAATMETVRFTEQAFRAAEEMGFRATIGMAMMDRWEAGTEMMGEETQAAMAESVALLERFHNSANGRLRYAFCPRGTRNITDDLWRQVVAQARQRQVLIHTHAAENREQTELLARSGGREAHYLDSMGALGRNLIMAHGVWLDPEEQALVARAGSTVAHCPSANLKLASGIAPVPEMLDLGVNVALGADGAPCNNNLDVFTEMRHAALIHKPRCGPRAMPAQRVLDLATINGARALGLEREIGSLEVGKRADLVIIRRDPLHAAPTYQCDPVAQLVYEHRSSDVETVLVDGEILIRDGRPVRWNERTILEDAETEIRELWKRARFPKPAAVSG
ncbi:MAG: 5'-deoxyadenosine deaminase [Chloroflexi bacterium]|nr:5'-deoxyadenosine deaminase [Chloroflexota bacterium]